MHINFIQSINNNRHLSEFKYHFFLRKVFMPRDVNFQVFSSKLYQGFHADFLNESSIYIVQMVNVYDKETVDLVVGFRNDQDAIKIGKEINNFVSHNIQSKIEFTTSFGIYFESLKKKQDEKAQSQKITAPKQIPKIQKRESRSRSRSKQYHQKKSIEDRFQPKEARDSTKQFYSIYIMMIPQQFTRNILLQKFRKIINHVRNIVSFQLRTEDGVSCYQLVTSDYNCFQLVLKQGFKIENNWLLVSCQSRKLRETLCKYQVIAHKKSRDYHNDKEEIAKLFKIITQTQWYKLNNVKIVNISHLRSGNFLITFTKQLTADAIKLQNWQISNANPLCLQSDRPSLQQQWYKFIKVNDISQMPK